ncbi:GNAT family N-acetyltransferase [Paenibacillus sp. BR2-3]
MGKTCTSICLNSSGQMIGNLYFNQQEPEAFQTWELGYVFNSDYQGKGLATESCRELLKYGFETLKIRPVIAKCNPYNVSSYRLLERLGFRREGHALQTVYFKFDSKGQPIWHDTYTYALLRNEWLDLQGKEAPRGKRLLQSHSVFPTVNLEKTSDFYSRFMGFKAVPYLEAKEPHVCLYRDETEIILTQSHGQKVIPNRVLYGYGYDAYFIIRKQELLGFS